MLAVNLITFFIFYQVNSAFSAEIGTIPGEISKQKCAEYAEYASKTTCPISDDTKLEIGNYHAERQEFPHVVMVGQINKIKKLKWRCTGSLISEQFVLLPAYCVIKGSSSIVRLGVTDLTDTEHVQDIKIKRVVMHPDYKPPSLYNDLAVIELESNVTVNEYVRPACLHTEKEIGSDRVIAAGWGRKGEEEDENDNKMQKAVVQIYDEEKCNDYYNTPSTKTPGLEKGIDYGTMVCVGTPTAITLQPKTGGPLLKYHKREGDSFNCMYDIVAIASFGPVGNARRQKDVPDVHTRIFPYVSWIEDTVWGNK